MIPRRISQIWLGPQLPADLLAMRKTVTDAHPDWVYKLWTEADLPSLGLTIDRLRDEFGSWASVSNFVRLLVLHRTGGFYLDLDFECLKPLDPLLLMGDALAAEQDGGRVCNAFLAATPNHPFVNWQLTNMGQFDRKDAAWGVYAATAAPRDGLTLVPRHLIYPYLFDDPPENRFPHADSLLIHHWRGSWVRKTS